MAMNSKPLRNIYNVTRLNREVRTILDTGFPLIWLEGELSNLACPASGHWYFSLKDDHAQVRCAMFRTRNRLLRFVPRNGMQVIARAKVGLYEPRGEFQLVIEHLEEAGEGALRQQFEQLKNKLNAQGLFAAEIKKTLPHIPKRIGVITSPTGAAIHDVLTTLKRRFASLEIIIYPVNVQGKTAAADIATTIQLADKRKECDVLLLTRGGGSLEDLWSFNEEVVAQAIFNCAIPLVSAIGHDIDFTIADFVADIRAATPTAAAELVSPDTKHWSQQFSGFQKRLIQLITNSLSQKQVRIDQVTKNIVHPKHYIEETSQRVDELLYRLQNRIKTQVSTKELQLSSLQTRCHAHNPKYKIQVSKQQTIQLFQKIKAAQIHQLDVLKQQFIRNTSILEAVSPLATLNRGYAYVNKVNSNAIIKDITQIESGDELITTVAKGKFSSTVTNKWTED
ncbi:Exodeoxyribonuclease VII large subunit [hydrothermal vent metagenome]|uniref:Exodeoxyribonuclease VII large subunit n=1 Tax=hydrothermal vent metagenome TaxID=652676 RepID=A0A3B1A589_9ZZZZ